MDNTALLQIISKIPKLKYWYLGSFLLRFSIFFLSKQNFSNVHTTHKVKKVKLARLGLSYFWRLPQSLKFATLPTNEQTYAPTTSSLRVNTRIVQKQGQFCVIHCVYIAWNFFDATFSTVVAIFICTNLVLTFSEIKITTKAFFEVNVDFLQKCKFTVTVRRLANGISSSLMAPKSNCKPQKTLIFTLRYCRFVKRRLSQRNIAVKSSSLTC